MHFNLAKCSIKFKHAQSAVCNFVLPVAVALKLSCRRSECVRQDPLPIFSNFQPALFRPVGLDRNFGYQAKNFNLAIHVTALRYTKIVKIPLSLKVSANVLVLPTKGLQLTSERLLE